MRTTLAAVLLAGLACRPAVKEEEVVQARYREYREAVKSAEPQRIAPLVTAERRKELSGPEVAAKLQLIVAFMPAEVRVLKTSVSGAEAVLEAEGENEGHRMTGTVRLQREDEDWKIDKEEWSVKIDLGAGVGLGEATAFFPDPQSPPQAHAALEGHQGEVSELAFSRDGRHLVSASYGDYSIRTWRLDTLEQVSEAKTENRVRGLAVSPDGKRLFTTDVRRSVLAWPLEEGRIGSPRVLVSDAGEALALSADGELVATGGFQSPLRLWNAADGTRLEELGGAPNQRALVFSRQGRDLLCGGDGNTFSRWTRSPRLWGLAGEGWREERRTIRKVSAEGGISAIDVSRDGKRLATGHNDSSIVIFDLPGGEERFNFYVRDAATRDVKWSPDGTILATAQQDKTVYLWDAGTGQRKAALTGHRDVPIRLAFSPDGATLASGGEDRLIFLWRAGPAPPRIAVPETPPPGAPALEAGAFAAAPVEHGGRRNLVTDPYAYHCASAWRRKGEAVCEAAPSGNPHFAVRYGGFFWQDAPIQTGTRGYVLLVARAASERVEADGDQTGLPYLYGYLVNSRDPNRFNAHLNGQQLMLRPTAAGEWGTVWGVFPVAAETGALRLYVQQADGSRAQNGSAARFDDVGVFLFDGEAEARSFAETYGR